MNEAKKQYRQHVRNLHRQRTRDIKLASGCVDCGYNKDSRALDFDHIDPSTKREAVSLMMVQRRSWGAIEAEIAKCEVRCANCHRTKTPMVSG
jgi:hypothetical protein